MQPIPLRGVIAAVVTPIDADGAPDAPRFLRLAHHLLDSGCDGLNVLGTTGEATSFSLGQRMRLMEAAAEGGLPMARLMVGTGAAASSDAAALTRHAAELGFAGALLLPPFYYKDVPEAGLLRYLDCAAAATSDLPLYLYNFPALSGIAWTLPLLARIVDVFGLRVAGLKDSSGDLPYAREAAGLRPGFAVFPSNEATLLEARAGAFAGCISATANINPALCARAWREGDSAALADAVAVRRLFDGRQLVPTIKAVLAFLHDDPTLAAVAPPLTEASAADLRTVGGACAALIKRHPIPVF